MAGHGNEQLNDGNALGLYAFAANDIVAEAAAADVTVNVAFFEIYRGQARPALASRHLAISLHHYGPCFLTPSPRYTPSVKIAFGAVRVRDGQHYGAGARSTREPHQGRGARRWQRTSAGAVSISFERRDQGSHAADVVRFR
eukprot:1804282-Pleurochrysis_carterae.AAC.1